MILTLFFGVLVVYVLCIAAFIKGFYSLKTFDCICKPKTRFTVIVPFRNEATQITKLIKSFELLDYPTHLFEIILVDDDSTDGWKLEHAINNMRIIKNYRTSKSPKKDAINTAITISKNEWIITTDADCEVPIAWLKTIDTYIQKEHKKMVAAGVCFLPKSGFLFAFQNLDFLSLQGVTIGSFGINKPFMCNGANFAYEKSFFYELKGFEGNQNIASGDDVFLLQKAVAHEPNAIGFCKSNLCVVKTSSQKDWKSLFYQRVRWASKSGAYTDYFSKSVAVVVFLTAVFFVAGCVLCLFGLINGSYLMVFFGVKFGIDFLLIRQSAAFFNQKIRYLFFSSLLYPFFTSAVALYALMGGYTWKDRRF